MAINHDMVEVTKKKQPRMLNDDKDNPIFQLNEPDASWNNGSEGDYRLLTMTCGRYDIAIYEAVSGTDRYPPGRNMHVRMSFEEMDKLMIGYTLLKEERERLEAERKAKSGDFDPFFNDDDDLP